MEFETLNQALILAEKGKVQGAKAIWSSLSDEFRNRVLECTKFMLTTEHSPPEYVTNIITKYGTLPLSWELIQRWKQWIPALL